MLFFGAIILVEYHKALYLVNSHNILATFHQKGENPYLREPGVHKTLSRLGTPHVEQCQTLNVYVKDALHHLFIG